MPPAQPSRRRFIGALGSSIGFCVAGCATVSPRGSTPPGRPGRTTTGRPTERCSPSTAPTAAPSPTEDGPEWRRATGEAVTATHSYVDEPGYDDDLEYFPENGTVRVVTARGSGEPRAFADWSFEEWGTFRATHVGSERVRAVTARGLGHGNFGVGVGRPPAGAQVLGTSITLYASKTGDGGTTTTTPAVGLERLAAVAPASVEATVSLDGDAFTHIVAVFVREWLLVTALASEGCR